MRSNARSRTLSETLYFGRAGHVPAERERGGRERERDTSYSKHLNSSSQVMEAFVGWSTRAPEGCMSTFTCPVVQEEVENEVTANALGWTPVLPCWLLFYANLPPFSTLLFSVNNQHSVPSRQPACFFTPHTFWSVFTCAVSSLWLSLPIWWNPSHKPHSSFSCSHLHLPLTHHALGLFPLLGSHDHLCLPILPSVWWVGGKKEWILCWWLLVCINSGGLLKLFVCASSSSKWPNISNKVVIQIEQDHNYEAFGVPGSQMLGEIWLPLQAVSI